MALSLARNIGLLRNQGSCSEFLSLASALSRSTLGQCKSSSSAPVPESDKNLYGEDRHGKYSPFQVNITDAYFL